MRSAIVKRLLFGLGAVALAAVLPGSRAGAATTTGTFAVTATVVATCNLAVINPLAFGNYSGVVLPGTTTIQATCTTAAPFNIGLNAGTATGATVTTRKMTGPGGALLNYGLFSDAAHSVNWGSTVGTDTVASTGTGAAQSFTVFGQIPAAQFVQAGAYSDTITVTLTF